MDRAELADYLEKLSNKTYDMSRGDMILSLFEAVSDLTEDYDEQWDIKKRSRKLSIYVDSVYEKGKENIMGVSIDVATDVDTGEEAIKYIELNVEDSIQAACALIKTIDKAAKLNLDS